MEASNNIKYLQNHEIDRSRWDTCIDNADNGLIYGYSFYLDAITTNWDGLVLNNYEAVFPLPYRKKWTIEYLYQPIVTPQLGLFGSHLNEDLVATFLDAIPKKFKYWAIDLNAGNTLHNRNFSCTYRSNYILSLKQLYEEIYNGYNKNVKRNIKKANMHGCKVQVGIPFENILMLAKVYKPSGNYN